MTKSSFTWLDPVPRPGWQNMAIDQALLDLADRDGATLLRLYRWEPYCLSFGRHEPACRRYDVAELQRLGLDTVRRPTGGRAVWHAEELTYAVAAPLAAESLGATYRRIHAMLLAAVRALGADRARLADRPRRLPGPGAGACFETAVGGEIVVDGRKLLGSAQVRQGRAFLQHGSLLLAGDQSCVRRLLDRDGGAPGEVTLAEAAGRPVGFDEAAAAVSAEWQGAPLPSSGAGTIVELAGRHAGRFRSDAWTWER
jgi:lipoate-protein ligase A